MELKIPQSLEAEHEELHAQTERRGPLSRFDFDRRIPGAEALAKNGR
jgi:hypothetical protein